MGTGVMVFNTTLNNI